MNLTPHEISHTFILHYYSKGKKIRLKKRNRSKTKKLKTKKCFFYNYNTCINYNKKNAFIFK